MRRYYYISILHLKQLKLKEIKNLMKPGLHISSKTSPMLKQNETEYLFPFFIHICIFYAHSFDSAI